MMRTKVLVVEDQAMPRQLFEMFIGLSKKYSLAASISEAGFAESCCRRFHVDLVIMDVVMAQGMNGLEAARSIKASFPEIRIIIVTSMPEVSYINLAKEIGVEGFWYKEVSEAPVLELMDRVMAGEIVYPETTPVVKFGETLSTNLTDKEYAVLRAMIGGATNTEIAEKLHISVAAVKFHIQNILDKTGYRNRTELAVKASESGLVLLEDP
jgi:DNA-binding NarL/FixJ family response regulator